MKGLIKTNYDAQSLAIGIIEQAAFDYIKAMRGEPFYQSHLSPEEMFEDCENFFRSEWYRTLTEVDGEKLMEDLRRKEYQETIDAMKNVLKNDGTFKLHVPKHDKRPAFNYKVPPYMNEFFREACGNVIIEMTKRLKELDREYEQKTT